MVRRFLHDEVILLNQSPVVWVPDPNLLALGLDTVVADEVLSSLENFKPETWGLPPYVG